MDTLSKVAAVLGAIYACATCLHVTLEGCRKVWPSVTWLERGALWTGVVGVHVGKILEMLGAKPAEGK